MLAEGMTAHALDWSLLRYAGSTEMGVEAADEEAAAVASVVRRRVPVPDQLIVLQDVQPAQGVAVQVVIFLEVCVADALVTLGAEQKGGSWGGKLPHHVKRPLERTARTCVVFSSRTRGTVARPGLSTIVLSLAHM